MGDIKPSDFHDIWNGKNPNIIQNMRGKQLILDPQKLFWKETMTTGNGHDVHVTKMAESPQG